MASTTSKPVRDIGAGAFGVSFSRDGQTVCRVGLFYRFGMP